MPHILSVQALVTHMPLSLTVIALNLILIVSPSGLGLVVSGFITILTVALPLGPLTTGTLTYSSSDPCWNPVTGLFWCTLSCLTAAVVF